MLGALTRLEAAGYKPEYHVQVKPASFVGRWKTVSGDGRQPQCMCLGLTPGRDYVVRVRASTPAGEGPWSQTSATMRVATGEADAFKRTEPAPPRTAPQPRAGTGAWFWGGKRNDDSDTGAGGARAAGGVLEGPQAGGSGNPFDSGSEDGDVGGSLAGEGDEDDEDDGEKLAALEERLERLHMQSREAKQKAAAARASAAAAATAATRDTAMGAPSHKATKSLEQALLRETRRRKEAEALVLKLQGDPAALADMGLMVRASVHALWVCPSRWVSSAPRRSWSNCTGGWRARCNAFVTRRRSWRG